MGKAKRTKGPQDSSGKAVGHKLPPGVQLVRVLTGHTNVVTSVAFAPQGGTLASGSGDQTVKLWEAASGRLLRTLEGHQSVVWSVAFAPQGGTLASGSDDKTVKLWEAANGRLLRTLEGYQHVVRSVAFAPQDGTLASGIGDKTVKLWDAASGRLLRTLEGHQNWVMSVGFAPQGGTLASGSSDNTVKLWEAASGRLLRTLEGNDSTVWNVAFAPQGVTLASGSGDKTVKLWEEESGRLLCTLEGHTGQVEAVAFSPDGSLLASKSDDHTIRLWSCVTWETVAVIPVPTHADWWIPALAFDPDANPARPLLATASSPPDTPNDDRCREIHLFELDREVLLGRGMGFQPVDAATGEERQAGSPSHGAHLKTAKVVLVGDTGVGKSAMAERLVNGHFVKTDSTHARRALTLDDDQVPQANGTILHRRTALWDLAGQPAYRLVHQLSMDDAAVACVLFDARSETNPFEGPAYWAEVLKQARTRVALKMLLVAARVDVGGLPASLDRINEFAARHGFAGVFQTSAKSGDGCSELLDEIRTSIPWDDLPSVSTPHELASLREFIACVKEAACAGVAPQLSANSRSDSATADVPQLLSIADLRQLFLDETRLDVPFDNFIKYLERLEDCDEIDLLVFHSTGQTPQPEDLVLLDPTRVDAYASALLVAAKDEPDGPGHLLESRIRDGKFKLETSERLADSQHEKHVLWYVMEYLFQRELALRELIAGEDYAVFPSQCTMPLKFPGAAAFGVAIGLSGPVRGIYATLIAQLAHFARFLKREFFEDAAAYHTPEGKRCLVRLRDNGNGTGEIEVSFDNGIDWKVRQGFLEFVEKHVESKAIQDSVTKRHAHHCESCGRPFDDLVVRERLKLNRSDLNCPYCDKRTPLVNLLVPATPESTQVVETIQADARAGKKRITAEWVIKAKTAQGKYDVFLSHNSKDKDAVEEIARRLKKAGIRPWLDKWDLIPGESVMEALEKAIETVKCAVLFFGPADVGRWHAMEIRAYVESAAGQQARFIPALLPGVAETPKLPPFVRQSLWVDLRNWQDAKSDAFARLQSGILGRSPGDSPRELSARDVNEWQNGGD